MEFFHRAPGFPDRLAVFPGTFNPVTIAHRALAVAALAHASEVLLVLPRVFPHKDYSGADFKCRANILRELASSNSGISVAASEKGLFVEIAAECREAYGDIPLVFVCGRDAAERIAGWDYGRPDLFPEMLRQFGLLVAARCGEYDPPANLRAAVRKLNLPAGLDSISASEVRGRIARGDPWEHLVPEEVRDSVRSAYSHPADA